MLHIFFYKQLHFRLSLELLPKVPKMSLKVAMKLLTIFEIEAQSCYKISGHISTPRLYFHFWVHIFNVKALCDEVRPCVCLSVCLSVRNPNIWVPSTWVALFNNLWGSKSCYLLSFWASGVAYRVAMIFENLRLKLAKMELLIKKKCVCA